jgi:hypothetical protein
MRGTRGNANEFWAPSSSDIITVDGDWGALEWTTYDFYESATLMIYVQANVDNNLYVCVRVKTDTLQNPGDYCEIVFDTVNNGGTTPQVDDFKFNASDSTSSDTFEDYRGDGSGWDSTYTSPYSPQGDAERDPDSGDGNFITYEFRIDFNEVWFPIPPTSGDEAGFAIHVYDTNAGQDHYWGSSDMNDPNSWGSLYYLPEFQEFIIPIFSMIFIAAVWMRKKKTKQ